MHEVELYIHKKLLLFCWGVTFFLCPIVMLAQDDDTSVVFTDSTTIGSWDEDYQNKAGKYSGEAVLRSVPDSTVARMKKEKEFAYANDSEYWVKEKKVQRKSFWDYLFGFFASDLVRVIFYILIGALILFVLYRIVVVNDLFIFTSSKRKRLATQESEASELDPVNLDNQIKDAMDQGRFNLAIRYLYLKTLYLLNDKNYIEFHPEATNNHYLTQMAHHKRAGDFRFLTRVYEYVWYGKFEINEQQFSLVYSNFKNFHSAI